MAQKKSKINKYLTNKEIYSLVQETVLTCYGVVSFGTNDILRTLLIKSSKNTDGIIIRRFANNCFSIDIYLLFARSVKITESLTECQKKVKYEFDKKYPKQLRHVNIYAVGLE